MIDGGVCAPLGASGGGVTKCARPVSSGVRARTGFGLCGFCGSCDCVVLVVRLCHGLCPACACVPLRPCEFVFAIGRH